MLNKLRFKFVLTAMIAITIVTMSIFGMIELDNHIRMNKQIDEIMNIIIENNGSIPKRDFNNDDNPYINKETRFTTRYFVAFLNDDNSVEKIYKDNISSVTEEEAQNLLNSVLNSNKKEGRIDNFKYKVSQDKKMTVFIDCTAQLRGQSLFTKKANIIVILGLFVTFLIIYVLSKRAIKPTIDIINKQKEFISNAGHDLKTPVSIILADVDVLELQENNKNNEFIESIKKQTYRLNELINTLLDLAKLDKMKDKLNFTEFSLNELIKDEIDEMKLLLKGKNLEYDFKDDVMLKADKNLIKELIIILLDNSIKYVDEGGKIYLEVSKQNKYAKFIISNTYKDVRDMDIHKIFDRFYREDKSRNSKKNGHGIGLSMAKSIVNMHNGKIYASNLDNDKIEFTALLPNYVLKN